MVDGIVGSRSRGLALLVGVAIGSSCGDSPGGLRRLGLRGVVINHDDFLGKAVLIELVPVGLVVPPPGGHAGQLLLVGGVVGGVRLRLLRRLAGVDRGRPSQILAGVGVVVVRVGQTRRAIYMLGHLGLPRLVMWWIVLVVLVRREGRGRCRRGRHGQAGARTEVVERDGSRSETGKKAFTGLERAPVNAAAGDRDRGRACRGCRQRAAGAKMRLCCEGRPVGSGRGNDGETAGNDGRGGLDLALKALQRGPRASEHDPERCARKQRGGGLALGRAILRSEPATGHDGGTE